ncbi:MAG: CPBP family intramembrane metalloprotease [Prolixibacteraceae bacterium]|nr:CPBP family intramembrane metalloprotease [Prolixibacteraceae bacterium]
MRKFIGYFKDFHAGYFQKSLYLFTALFIVFLIVINYTFDIEDSFIDSFYGKPVRILLFLLYHGIAYYGVLLIIYLHDKDSGVFSRKFWVKSLLGLLILSVDRSVFPYVAKILIDGVDPMTYRFYFKTLFNLYGVITIVFALFIVWLIYDRAEKDGFYGLRFSSVGIKAYLVLLLIMIPILYFSTYMPDILDYYPTYKRAGGVRFSTFYDISENWAKLIYESAYLFDFVNTEILFRGFLVIGLSKLLGKNVVLPMAATYAVLHFGKPIGETVSSVFGGYILGIIALYSRNIWGGIFIHGGIAFFMEVFAFWRQ